ncbi:MAG: SulP family inorganic anion transporter, partial [Pseudonocardia sp.]
GVLADFMSRSVLVGFLTGVGIQVAVGQLADVTGVPVTTHDGPALLVQIARGLPDADGTAVAIAAGVVVVVVGLRLIDRRIPGALIAVVAAIAVSAAIDLDTALLGPVPSGLPTPTLPGVGLEDLRTVLPLALSMLVVILAQSAATARAYAARHDERADTDQDVVGLAGANLASALTGTFVVNGSPTKTQIVDSAGGRSQLAQLCAALLALVVVLVATPSLALLPLAALAAVVLLIGVELVDVDGLRRLWAVRRSEWALALVTALAVVLFGVQTGIAMAVALSIADHLRHSYHPHSSVLRKSPAGHWHSEPVAPGLRTVDGLIVYRFGSGLYFANASRFAADVALLTTSGPPVRWFCLDAAAIGDVDYSAGEVLDRVRERLEDRGIRLVLSSVVPAVRRQLDRYGFVDRLGADRIFDTSGEVLETYDAAT